MARLSRQVSNKTPVTFMPNNTYIYVATAAAAALIVAVIAFVIAALFRNGHPKYDEGKKTKGTINEGDGGLVCVPRDEYQRITEENRSKKQRKEMSFASSREPVRVVYHERQVSAAEQQEQPQIRAMQRDTRAMRDPLYPPYNRQDVSVLAHQPPLPIRTSVPAREEDAFRIVGYLKSTEDSENKKDAGNNVWKCMGRMKNNKEGEFYLVPANTNDDLKIPLTRDMMKGPERFRDLYTLPTEASFNSPFLHSSKYIFVELPKQDLTSSLYN